MGPLERYYLYNSEGKKMFTVIPSKDTNTLLGMSQTAFVNQEHHFTDSELRQFKAGDRVRVLRLNTNEVDFYATLKDYNDGHPFILSDCSDGRFENSSVFKPNTGEV